MKRMTAASLSMNRTSQCKHWDLYHVVELKIESFGKFVASDLYFILHNRLDSNIFIKNTCFIQLLAAVCQNDDDDDDDELLRTVVSHNDLECDVQSIAKKKCT